MPHSWYDFYLLTCQCCSGRCGLIHSLTAVNNGFLSQSVDPAQFVVFQVLLAQHYQFLGGPLFGFAAVPKMAHDSLLG